MNAVEIEEAISKLATEPFDAEEFPFAFLEAFGNKSTTIKRLRSGSSNSSDIDNGVLQRSNVHIAVCREGEVTRTLAALKASAATAKARAKFILATDGFDLEAEDLNSGETVACAYSDFANHFGFFLPLAGITTVKQIRNNPIDIQATSRLNRLYVELLKENEDWTSEDRRHDMNQFMSRLIFCFFAEDTDIFNGEGLFTATIEQMSDSRSGNTHEVIAELFRAMDTKIKDRAAGRFRPWADIFPYVNGGLFAGMKEVPRFSRIARSYLLHAGSLNWKAINPDIFGSMIQAVADDEERGSLGMHYTSVPNILKVLNPLFLDGLRAQLEAAGDNPRKLLNLRKRLARIRVFDPACGSGNFLVIAYIQMREVEAEILRRRGEADRRSWIKLENFYGIEIKDFAAEVARLALLIAEFQCDVRLIGQKEARALVLPLKKTGQIYTGNALRMDWSKICPPITSASSIEHDLAGPTGRLALDDHRTPDWETYICGNPPYKGHSQQTPEMKADLKLLFSSLTNSWKSLDYISGWVLKASQYNAAAKSAAGIVSTNSICQGQQVPILWPILRRLGTEIAFAYTSFKWSNLASKNAGVTVVIVGLAVEPSGPAKLYEQEGNSEPVLRVVSNINAYLISGPSITVYPVGQTPEMRGRMVWGNKPTDGGNFFFSHQEKRTLIRAYPQATEYIRPFFGSIEFIRGLERHCMWLEDSDLEIIDQVPEFAARIERIKRFRAASKAAETRPAAAFPHRFRQVQGVGVEQSFIIPKVSSESREYLPVGLLPKGSIVSDNAFALYDAPLWNIALIASRLHLVWIATVCGKLKTDFRYSNTLGWNTFPVPTLTDKMKADLTRCAEDVLLAREAHFPATIAELYDPKKMPEDLRHAHDRNDEVLERIYIGRRFRNDTERLEKLFELYTQMAEVKKKPA